MCTDGYNEYTSEKIQELFYDYCPECGGCRDKDGEPLSDGCYYGEECETCGRQVCVGAC